MPDSIAVNIADTLAADSVVVNQAMLDSIRLSKMGEQKKGFILIDPLSEYKNPKERDHGTINPNQGMSWIYLLIAALFCAIAIKSKGSAGYLRALVSDLTDTRVRHNLFDDTVKEASLIILLNAMWVLCSGIMLWIWMRNHFASQPPGSSLGISMLQSKGILICSGMTAAYLLLMILAYWVVGNVFSNVRETNLWVNGAFASTGLEAFLMFPLALIALNYASWSGGLCVVAIIVFIVGKIAFIYKGFRIFFSEISSWLLFLYYICCLEIIPVILTFAATIAVLSG